MQEFNVAIYELAQTAVAEFNQAKSAGKVPNNPRSEAHFFSAWVTKAIKQQRFPHNTAKILVGWQKRARTQGINAGIRAELEQVVGCYDALIQERRMAAIQQSQFDALFDALDAADWHLEQDYPVTRKVSHHTDGQASLVVCCQQWQQAFDESGTLVKPISLYARGDLQQLVDLAYQQRLLLHKISAYKSLVKFHAEMSIYPCNDGEQIAEFPSQG